MNALRKTITYAAVSGIVAVASWISVIALGSLKLNVGQVGINSDGISNLENKLLSLKSVEQSESVKAQIKQLESQLSDASVQSGIGLSDWKQVVIVLLVALGIAATLSCLYWLSKVFNQLSPEAIAKWKKAARTFGIVLATLALAGILFAILVYSGVGGILFIAGVIALALILWIAHLIGKAARRKERSYGSFFLLSLVFSPLVMALIVAVLPFPKTDEFHSHN